MNLLELDFNKEDQDYYLKVLIDGNEILETIDEGINAAIFSELERSCLGGGDYLIFNCSCGIADCGGWKKVKVIHKNRNIEWNFNFANKNYNFIFDQNFYKGEIERFRFELNRSKIILQPEHIIEPE